MDHRTEAWGYGYEARGGDVKAIIMLTLGAPNYTDNISRIKYHRVTSPRITVWINPDNVSQIRAMIHVFLLSQKKVKLWVDKRVSYNRPLIPATEVILCAGKLIKLL